MVGIHRSTLSQWISDRLITPHYGGEAGRKQLFTTDDVRLGQEVVDLLKKRRGQFSRAQLFEIVKGERTLDEWQNYSPPGAPRPNHETQVEPD